MMKYWKQIKTSFRSYLSLLPGMLLLSAAQIQADTALDSIAGYTLSAVDTGFPVVKTVAAGMDRFTEFNDGAWKRWGPYSYVKLSATTGRGVFLRNDDSGDSDTVVFAFTTETNGAYSNARVRQGMAPDTRTGTFTASSVQPELNRFLVATNSLSMSVAFDGRNYLVGLENPGPPPTIAAQMISTNGTKVGPLIATGRTGIAAVVAFDGTNYLMIWEDDGLGTCNGATGWQVYGQFISKAGLAVGIPFNISGLGIWFDGIKTMAFGGGKYLVTYTRLIVPANGGNSNNRYIAGRIVNPDGTMGSEFRISTGFGDASDVAFDGVNFFVVWCEDGADQEIRGRFVSPAGLPGAEISVNASAAPSDNPKSVAFDGTNYLVVWNDEVGGAGTGEWDSLGQLVSASGVLVGESILITGEPGPQMATSVAFDGSNYLAVWIDMQSDANWNVYGQYIGRSGSRAGARITVSVDAGNEMGGVGFANGNYILLVNNGVAFGEDGNIIDADSANLLFLTPPKPRIQTGDATFGARTNRFGFTITGTSILPIVVEAATNAAGSVWVPVGTNILTAGSSYFSDSQWTNYSSRIYRLRSP